jgi:hypothetical protein
MRIAAIKVRTLLNLIPVEILNKFPHLFHLLLVKIAAMA